MQTFDDRLKEAISNMASGTSRAAELKRTASNPEVRELAKAVHVIGYGAQQVALALLEDRKNRPSGI